ncbi:13541_t:CDS:2, partial [Cetraspora pellucida]
SWIFDAVKISSIVVGRTFSAKDLIVFLTENWEPDRSPIVRSDKFQGQLFVFSIEPFNLFQAV